MLATVVEGDSKVSISLATQCKGGHISFTWIAQGDPY